MNEGNQKIWGLVLLLLSVMMPFPIPSVPTVTLDAGIVQNETIFCDGCNPLIFGQSLNINTASIDHLMSLPNIGEKRAKVILEHRMKNGKFQNLKDLDEVQGIGPKTLLKLQPYIVIE